MNSQPTQPRKISEADAKRIEAFKNLLLDYHAEHLRKTFMDLYFRYSQLLLRNPDDIYVGAEDQLYTLQLFIENLQ